MNRQSNQAEQNRGRKQIHTCVEIPPVMVTVENWLPNGAAKVIYQCEKN